MSDQPPAFPFTSPDPRRPPAELAELRRTAPVSRVTLPGGHLAWLVTRHADVKQVLADPRFSREAITRPGAPRLLPVVTGSKSIFMMDPPEHTRLRKLVARAFTARRMETLRPWVQELCDGMVDAMVAEGSPADLIAHLAQPLPITVICGLLGVPVADQEKFRTWTDMMLSVTAYSPEEVRHAAEQLDDYLRRLIAVKRNDPADDLLTVLITAREESDRLSEEELLAFGQTMLLAGYHATSSEIVHGMLALLSRPGEVARLREQPDGLPAAVEELLRISQAGGGVGPIRIALEAVELGGVHIAAGDAVLPSINAANRDELVFARPTETVLDRPDNPHLAFGHGIHHCLGAHLGRVELQTAVGTLLRRLPGLRLGVEEEELVWERGRAFSRPKTLPVAW